MFPRFLFIISVKITYPEIENNLMRSGFFFFTTLFILLSGLYSCQEKTEQFQSELISDYAPLVVGKYITYEVDSLIFTNLGRSEETHKYQEKHLVDAEITDNLGRPSYRIIKYLRDSAGTQPWVSNGTYFITPLKDQYEVVENNLRFIKLHAPFVMDYNWKGNKYLPVDSFVYNYGFSNDDNMDQWDYVYDDFLSSATIGGQQVNDIWDISVIDEAINAPVTDPTSYGSRTLSREKYAKDIGLVYRDHVLWEYQPNTGGSGGGYRTGFGVKMWMIDHN